MPEVMRAATICHLLIAALASVFALPAVEEALSAPNLAGTWIYDEAKTVIRGDAPAGFIATQLAITQSPTEVTVASDTGGGRRIVTSVYKLDGSENVVPGPPNWVTKARAAWDNAKLVIRLKMVFPGPAGDIAIETQDAYSIADSVLTLERTQAGRTWKLLYNKSS